MPDEGMFDAPGMRAALDRASAGTILPFVAKYGTSSYLLVAVDSVLEARPAELEEVFDAALADARAARSLERGPTRAQRLESDLLAGKAWEQAIDRAGNVSDAFTMKHGDAPGVAPAVPGLDSLLFGPEGAAIPAGAWRKVPGEGGTWFVRVLDRIPPDAAAESNRALLGVVVLNRRLYDYDEELRRRYTVVVVDADLRDRLPPPPALP
jgi:hypothetical protein